jgi:hypothetical protein
MPLDDYAKLQAISRAEEEFMVHPVHGQDPDKPVHRTYKTIEPEGEVAVVQRPEGAVKVLFYTCSGEKKACHTEVTMDRDAAFNFAMEILQQTYRVGQAE